MNDPHDLTLRELKMELGGVREVMQSEFRAQRAIDAERAKASEERDRRYEERDKANKEALRAALASTDKMAEKTEEALKEYKQASNEWRSTVQDLVSRLQGKGAGAHQLWLVVGQLVGWGIVIWVALRPH